MDYTANYQLPVWAETDRILRTDFNDAFAAIDTALGELPAKGNCQIVYGSYTGTGKYDIGNRNTLTFPGQPLLVLILQYSSGNHLILVRGCAASYVVRSVQISPDIVNLDWSAANKVSWHCGSSADNQANLMNQIYYYVAFIPAEE